MRAAVWIPRELLPAVAMLALACICTPRPAWAKARCFVVPRQEAVLSQPSYRIKARLATDAKSVEVELFATGAHVIEVLLQEWSITDAKGSTSSAVPDQFARAADRPSAPVPAILVPPGGGLDLDLFKRTGDRLPDGTLMLPDLLPLDECGFSGVVKLVVVIVDDLGRHVEVVDVPAKVTAGKQ